MLMSLGQGEMGKNIIFDITVSFFILIFQGTLLEISTLIKGQTATIYILSILTAFLINALRR